MTVGLHGGESRAAPALAEPALPSDVVDAYLRRLGVPSPSLDLAGLTRLHQRHLQRVPFHNLALLACGGKDPGLPDVVAVAADNARGVGGTCHLMTPPFVALLQSVGFDAWLAAADINERGDHFVGIVRIDGVHYLTDVGNGHPYDRPWPVDAGTHASSTFGWEFRFTAEAGRDGRTHTLLRRLPGADWDRVYRTSVVPQPLEAFAGIIRDHHTLDGFGPFRRALRAVRMTERRLLTLRDDRYRRYGGAVPALRRVRGGEAFERLMLETFELPRDLVRSALDALAPVVEWLEGPLPCPRVLFATTCTDRPDQVQALARSLVIDRAASGWEEDDVGLLVLDNGVRSAPSIGPELPSRVVRMDSRRRSIGESRKALSAQVVQHLTGPRADGLPHPDDGPVIVWMVDDDLEAMELAVEGGVRVARPHAGLLERAAGLWREHPEISVAVGGTTGDPPIPAHDAIRRQAEDLVACLEELRAMSPEAPWTPAENNRDEVDYHYDLPRSGRHGAPFRWEPSRSDATARDVLDEVLAGVPRLVRGENLTRALVGELPMRRTSVRGGNALFFDLDALDVAPYPELDLGWGRTRRADMIWAQLVAGYPEFGLFTAPLSLLHGRRAGDGSSPLAAPRRTAEELGRFIVQQAAGIVVCRLLENEAAPTSDAARSLLEDRLARTSENLAAASAALQRCAELLRSGTLWSRDVRTDEAASELDEFASSLVSASRTWPEFDVEALVRFASELWELRGPSGSSTGAWS